MLADARTPQSDTDTDITGTWIAHYRCVASLTHPAPRRSLRRSRSSLANFGACKEYQRHSPLPEQTAGRRIIPDRGRNSREGRPRRSTKPPANRPMTRGNMRARSAGCQTDLQSLRPQSLWPKDQGQWPRPDDTTALSFGAETHGRVLSRPSSVRPRKARRLPHCRQHARR